MTSRHARRLAVWIAMLAILLAALAPTVSRTLARGSSSPVSWAEICTASGMQWINLAAAATPDFDDANQRQPARSAMLDHCPLCLLAADRLGPAPDAAARFFVPGDPVAPAIERLPAYRSLAPLVAHARGPPLTAPPPFLA